MTTTIAIIAPGAMGSAIGKRLVARGAVVLTCLEGRSPASAARAEAAGMVAVPMAELRRASLVLSIVPPSEAVAVALQVAAVLQGGDGTTGFIDCNAISPQTWGEVAAALAPCGCVAVDGAIIGGPPTATSKGPSLYVSGDDGHQADVLGELGLLLKRLEAPAGAASALKMTYAGINKGFLALATGVLLGAARNGCAEALMVQLRDSLPGLTDRLTGGIPDMYAKAYRWVAEMHEIAEFLGPDDPAAGIYRAAAEIYEEMAADTAGDKARQRLLNAMLGRADA